MESQPVSGAGLRRPGTGASTGEQGFFMVGWFVKIAIFAALIGVLAFDGIAVGLGHSRLTAAADDAATAAASSYGPNKSVANAYLSAVAAAQADGATLAPTQLTFAGDTVTVTLHTTIHTFFLGHLPDTQSWTSPTVVVTQSLDPS
jgi:hypothetical protein